MELRRLVWVVAIALVIGCSEVKFEKSPPKTSSVTPPTGSSGSSTGGGSSVGGGSSTSGGGSSSSGGSSSGGSSSGDSSSGGSSGGGSSSGGSSSGGSGCDTNTIYNLYDTSVTHHNPNQHEVAIDCIDAAVDYNGNIYFGPSEVDRTTRFGVTCASRWCAKHVSDGNSVGVIEGNVQFNGNMLDLGANIPIECRSNRITSPPGACETQIQNNPPLEAKQLWFPACSPCGCDLNTVASHWTNGPGDLVNCATNYCTGLGGGFRWGILSEVNDQGYLIRCSRAAF